MKPTNSIEVKKNNKNNIFRYIYSKQKTSKQEIASDLNLSLLTVSHNLVDLEKWDIIRKSGFLESTGGRKANLIIFNASHKIAVGLELLKKSYEIVAIDLYGTILKTEKFQLLFQNTDHYFETVSQSVNQFILSMDVVPECILGIGIVLQGLISSDGTRVTYGKILDCTNLTVDCFSKYIPYPCRMFHDAESAATIELWENTRIQNAIFFHIRSNLSGALIADGKFLIGSELKSGVFEHMTIVPNGKLCYCGKKGCVDCYCSSTFLSTKDSDLAVYFQNLRSGEKKACLLWEKYLNYLAIAIDNLHMLIDYDIILGGKLALYFTEKDLDDLHKIVALRSAFPTERKFIIPAKSASEPIAKGAALSYIHGFINHYLTAPV